MQLLEGTAVSDIDIYAGLGGGKKRVRRDDGKIFDSIAAASMSAYGYAGSGIKRAITTGARRKGIIGTGQTKFQKILRGSTLVPWYTDTRQENRALLNEIGCHPL